LGNKAINYNFIKIKAIKHEYRKRIKRSGSKCELCGTTENLKVYQVLPTKKGGLDEKYYGFITCIDQIENQIT
jgi:hypothetical protein